MNQTTYYWQRNQENRNESNDLWLKPAKFWTGNYSYKLHNTKQAKENQMNQMSSNKTKPNRKLHSTRGLCLLWPQAVAREPNSEGGSQFAYFVLNLKPLRNGHDKSQLENSR